MSSKSSIKSLTPSSFQPIIRTRRQAGKPATPTRARLAEEDKEEEKRAKSAKRRRVSGASNDKDDMVKKKSGADAQEKCKGR